VPFLAVVPWTTTVSPGARPESDVLALRVTDVEGVSVTSTRFPLAFVTYRVEPLTSVTVPVAAAVEAPPKPLVPEAPVPRVAPNRDAMALAIELVPVLDP
jgi:hypothetical protein